MAHRAPHRDASLSLPPWARLHPPIVPTNDDDDLEALHQADDCHLRTVAYHTLAAHLDQAFTDALKDVVGPVYTVALNRLLQLSSSAVHDVITSPTNATTLEAEGTLTATAASTDHDRVSWFTLRQETPNVSETVPPSDSETVPCSTAAVTTTTTRYHPLLLPLLLVQGPFGPLDRSAYLSFLVQTTRQRPGTCTVVVQLRLDACTVRREARHEIVRQCLAHHPDAPTVQGHKRRRRRQSKPPLGLTESLVEWASSFRVESGTTSIVVVMQADHSHTLYGHDRQHGVADLLQWLADRRIRYGLPFVVILMEPIPHRRPIPFDVSWHHVCLVHRVTWPTTTTTTCALYQAWTRRVEQAGLGWPDGASVRLRDAWGNGNTPSMVDRVTRTQQSWARALAQPGSYASVMGVLVRRGTGVGAVQNKDHGRRMTAMAYAVTETDRKRKRTGETAPCELPLLRWLVEWESHRQMQRVASQIRQHLHVTTMGTPLDDPMGVTPRPIRDTAVPDARLDQDQRRALLVMLLACRNQLPDCETAFAYLDLLPGDRAPYEVAIRTRTQAAMNELMVLLDQCTTVSMVLYCLDTLTTVKPSPRVLELSSCPNDAPQPRRDQVRALLEPFRDGFRIPACLYHCLRDCASLSEGEWFDRFVATASDATHPYHVGALDDTAGTTTRPMDWFAAGVRQLELVGLVRRRRVHHKQGDSVVYDKTALVWCSGD